ncbi:MAG: hypothetical protein JO242_26990 [Streptosporangiaceae bacterium]|nr:hypothetical protein [Streptosporangiaceae bacterium]
MATGGIVDVGRQRPPVPPEDVSVPPGEGTVTAAATPSRRGERRGMRWRKALIALTVIFATFCAATARLFIWPAQGVPPWVSAIVMVDGPGGGALSVAMRLAAQHRAAFLVISRGTVAADDPCPRPVAGVTLICFNPAPPTTQGEAEFVGRLANRYHWRSVAVVAITPQAWRARLRVERCFAGQVYAVAAPIRAAMWPYQIAYEWGALVKALVIQRGC